MARNETVIDAPIDIVWSVLSDPRTYDSFVVGTKRIRRFDPRWPEPGSALHHTIGVGPAATRDETVVIEADPPNVLRLHAGTRPFAVSLVLFTLDADGPERTRLAIVEEPIEGPLHAVWNPVFDGVMWLRNVDVLRRLRSICQRRAAVAATASA